MSYSCLVLGGSGFIGSHLCESLLRDGHRVKVLVPEGLSLHNLSGIIKQIEILRLDLAEAGQRNEIWGGVDRVFHLACTTRPKLADDDPARDLEENLIATVKILDRCAANNVGRFIFISSGGTVYGKPVKLPIPEDHPKAPICSYGIHKHVIELYLQFYKTHYGLDYRVARVSNAYGERQTIYGNQGLVGTLMERLLTGQPVLVYGNGAVVRDYIHVSDVVSALIGLANAPTGSAVFNVGSGCGKSIMEMIRLVEKALQLKGNLQMLPPRPMDVETNILDIAKIRKELAWEPKVQIEEGIARTAAWWRAEAGNIPVR